MGGVLPSLKRRTLLPICCRCDDAMSNNLLANACSSKRTYASWSCKTAAAASKVTAARDRTTCMSGENGAMMMIMMVMIMITMMMVVVVAGVVMMR